MVDMKKRYFHRFNMSSVVSDADLSLAYPIVAGPVTVTLRAYLHNAFNNQHETERNMFWTTSPQPDYPGSLYDPDQPQNNPDYGKYLLRNDPRLFRAEVRVSFCMLVAAVL